MLEEVKEICRFDGEVEFERGVGRRKKEGRERKEGIGSRWGYGEGMVREGKKKRKREG